MITSSIVILCPKQIDVSLNVGVGLTVCGLFTTIMVAELEYAVQDPVVSFALKK